MTRFGYKLSSEEFGPGALIQQARRAEEVGFSFAAISDHYHPWIDRQGEAPFVWSVLGAIAGATDAIDILTGVTCPTVRVHPAVMAQAAATTAAMMPGRFSFGVGSGENLNEHVTGAPWPPADLRIEMLEEAIEVIRKLWGGDEVTYRGRHYRVENARIYTLPDEPPPIVVAASGTTAIEMAGRVGDGLCSLAPMPDVVERFEGAGGAGKPKYCEVHVCYAPDVGEARRITHEWWPMSGIKGQLMQELATPGQFSSAAEMLTEEAATATVACGPDPKDHLDEIHKFVDAGYDHVWIHNIGPNQDDFFTLYEKEVLPELS